MSRAVFRTVLGFLIATVVALVVSPLVWTAGAQPRSGPGRLAAAGSTTVFTFFPALPPTTPVPTPTVPVTTARPATAPRPRATGAPSTTSTTSTTLPATTVAPLPAVAPAPVTLPLAVGRQSAHVSAVFPILGGMGILVLIALLATQWFLTAPGRRGPTL